MSGEMAMTDRMWEIIAGTRDGVLATIRRDGMPHLSNVYYVADRSTETIRLSTTTDRAKGRNLQRDPRAALYVAGEDFVKFAVAEGPVSLAIADQPGDAAINELFEVHRALGAASERTGFDDEMIANHRMVVRLRVERVYGLFIDRPRQRPRGAAST
jgi:PPOX class probable F420-dependent enzyme